jgi:formylmethanofuran dehydrogenase subunit E
MQIVTAETLGNGNLTGADHGATVSLIFDHSEPGGGPRLHRYPYDETWVVQEGQRDLPSRGRAPARRSGRHRDHPA